MEEHKTPTPMRAPLSVIENMFLGIGGGSLELTIHMPLLSWKFARQEGRPLPTTFLGWYRGLLAQVSSVAPITALQVMANGILEMLITGNKRNATDMEKILTSCGAGVISGIVYSPVDLITIQQQRQSKGITETMRYIQQNYGIFKGFYRGIVGCAIREGIYTCGYLGMAPVLTDFYKRKYPKLSKSEFFVSLLGAITSGLIAAAITHPVDTAKTCIQSDLGKTKYKNTMGTIVMLVKEGGVGALYKGAVPRSIRLTGAYCIISYCREKAIQWKTKHLYGEL